LLTELLNCLLHRVFITVRKAYGLTFETRIRMTFFSRTTNSLALVLLMQVYIGYLYLYGWPFEDQWLLCKQPALTFKKPYFFLHITCMFFARFPWQTAHYILLLQYYSNLLAVKDVRKIAKNDC